MVRMSGSASADPVAPVAICKASRTSQAQAPESEAGCWPRGYSAAQLHMCEGLATLGLALAGYTTSDIPLIYRGYLQGGGLGLVLDTD